jgi:hypothetical protein
MNLKKNKRSGPFCPTSGAKWTPLPCHGTLPGAKWYPIQEIINPWGLICQNLFK